MSHDWATLLASREASTPKKPTKKKPELESSIQRKIMKWLERLGAKPLRVNSGKAELANAPTAGFTNPKNVRRVNLAPAGTADTISCLPVALPLPYGVVGVYLAIEVKRPGEKPTVAQQRFIDKINALGGIAFYAVSVDDAKRQLNARLRERFGVSNEHER